MTRIISPKAFFSALFKNTYGSEAHYNRWFVQFLVVWRFNQKAGCIPQDVSRLYFVCVCVGVRALVCALETAVEAPH